MFKSHLFGYLYWAISNFRAISVLLGEAWKSLSLEEREQYSQRAKVMADEQKKIFPDCWKRKRTLTSTSVSTSSSNSSNCKTSQQIPNSGSEAQTSVVSTSLGTQSVSLDKAILPHSCLGSNTSSTTLVVKNIDESKTGSHMISLGNSTNINVTVPK